MTNSISYRVEHFFDAIIVTAGSDFYQCFSRIGYRDVPKEYANWRAEALSNGCVLSEYCAD